MFFGFLFNYLLQHASSRFLDIGNFGIFYESIVIVNLSVAPAIIFGMYFTRFSVGVKKNEHSSELLNYIYIIQIHGLKILFISILILLIFWLLLDFKSILLFTILLIVIYSNYLIESLKTILEGSKKVVLTGIFTSITLFFRFIFAISFLYFGGTVWSGMLGIMLSNLLIFFLFKKYHFKNIKFHNSYKPKFNKLFKGMLFFVLSFSLVTLVLYLDVLLVYFIFPVTQLSIYTASSVLPKGLLLFTQPLTKAIYPLISNNKVVSNHNYIIDGVKMIGIMLFISCSGVFTLYFFKDLFVTGAFSVNHIDQNIFSIIIFSIVPLTLLRTLVAISLARNDDKSPLLLFFPVGFYIIYLLTLESINISKFSYEFVMFSWLVLIYYLIVKLTLYLISYKKIGVH